MIQSKKVVGVIGSSGSGKSTFCRVAKNFGAYVIDADEVGHDVLENEAKDELISAFGSNKREHLREVVFLDVEKLNTITHKYIEKRIDKLLKICENKLIVIDASDLHKSNAIKWCDKVVVVVSDRAEQIARTAERDGVDTTNRINAQDDNETYIKYADVVIHNDGDLEKLKTTAVQFWRKECDEG